MSNPEHPAATATRKWLERAVIGLNLCPFARAPYRQSQVHLAVSEATDEEGLLNALVTEIEALVARSPQQRDTTLLILGNGLADFAAFNDFAAAAEGLLDALGLEGVLQIATFHPDYRFADTPQDAIENYTNRAPYPILHLLREDSVSRAVDAMQDPDEIYHANIDRLRALGKPGWDALWED
ncbi:DUF1415 domain-containing protein [Marinobacter nanhaiticus D15-8W]|uniref:DUF1415 domain-containing protein n=1 Tax=Marinobacter nanhaiticus D15-8W TaxID=626887 RepID=N6W4Q2_9GAMM|nr:DUF1415 domain-containing protein [Marinobacter nanhaiticus]ENO15129.1 DUF1415 domain-containing protein [Marinobacter nanhaiticus D15-8W]BES69172.1 DUF1415 domain-containing protein [Marinobacter nanhaiticus D15-8W]